MPKYQFYHSKIEKLTRSLSQFSLVTKFSVQSINVFAMFLAHLMVHVPKSNVASMMPQLRLVTELPALEFWIQKGYTLVRESHVESADNMMTRPLA